MHDVVIVGGGPAGLTAAITLGRFRRTVRVIDAGQQANRFVDAAHNVFTRDGTPPSELIAVAVAQATAYPTVSVTPGVVRTIAAQAGGFAVTLEDGETLPARKVLLALGVRDVLPDVPGLAEAWGRGVYHCPYCHGWEARDKPLAVLAQGEAAFHLAGLLRALSDDVVVCAPADAPLSDAHQTTLARHGVRVLGAQLARVDREPEHGLQLVFADGTNLARHALFVRADLAQHGRLAAALDCALTPNGMIQVDVLGRTSVPGIYAGGDATGAWRQIGAAAMGGMAAAAGVNTDLVAEAFM